jgi:diguanylate cyclase (GGDEF)-like protein
MGQLKYPAARDMWRLRTDSSKPTILGLIVRVTVVVSAAELAIMLLLGGIAHELSEPLEALVDVVILIAVTTPVLYFWIVRPFVKQRDEAMARLEQIADTDPLTGLANRRLLVAHFAKYEAARLRQMTFGALLLADLDGFKPVNDSLGHEAGDRLLHEVARRLESAMRKEDVVSRLGGDEFVILASRLGRDEATARNEAVRIAEKLRQAIARPFEFDGRAVAVGLSVGIRMLCAEAVGADAAIRDADQAMYRAKRAGKGRVRVFPD